MENFIPKAESFIKGYKAGDRITLLNTVYVRAQKEENGRYGSDYLYLIYKDLETGEKKIEEIERPEYTFFMAKSPGTIGYNRLYIKASEVYPVQCEYRKIKKTIAQFTGNKEWYKSNLETGNYRDNDKLLNIPSVFFADTNIEDYYRFLFDITYANEPFNPTKLYFDIETDIINMRGDFPEPGECPVNAITVVDAHNKNIYTLLLDNYDNPLIQEFKKENKISDQLKHFVRSRLGGWKREAELGLDKFNYKVVMFDEEMPLIEACFGLINFIKPDFALAWNIAFDLPYLIARIRVLGYNPTDIICHPDFNHKVCEYFIDHRADKFEERGDTAIISSYSVYLDQLISYASRRKGQRAVGSYKLDYIGQITAGVRKLDYSHITTSIAKLPYLDYKTFVFYNCMDTIVQYCVEQEVGDIDFVFGKALANVTRYGKVHRQTTYLINRMKRDLFNMGYIMGNNINKSNEKVSFAGAYTSDPKKVSDKPKVKLNGIAINVLKNDNDYDFTALYPSIIEQNNMSPATMYGKILFDYPVWNKENKFNNEYFDRTVWFMEDLMSNNVIDFCNRYLGMPDYEQMYDSINTYFTQVKNPSRGLRMYDSLQGKRIMTHNMDSNKPRQLYHIIDKDNEKRRLIRIFEKMPNKENII